MQERCLRKKLGNTGNALLFQYLNADRSLLCPAWVWCHQFDPILHHLIYTFVVTGENRSFFTPSRSTRPGASTAPPLPPISSPTHVLPCVAYKSSLTINLHANVPPWWPMESRCSESRWPHSFKGGRVTIVHLSLPDREVEKCRGRDRWIVEILKKLASLLPEETAALLGQPKWTSLDPSFQRNSVDTRPPSTSSNFRVSQV